MRRLRRIVASGRSLVVVMLIAVIAVGVAIAGEPTASARRMPPARADEISCPLSLGQQEHSIRAFAKMMPVFRHPRCSNCHGGVNPFEAEATSRHGGGQMDPDVNAEQCQACHDQLAGWDTPGTPMCFVGRRDEDLCIQMKTFEETGASFIEHIRNDHGGIQFIAAGFKGERGLDGVAGLDRRRSALRGGSAPRAPRRSSRRRRAHGWRRWAVSMPDRRSAGVAGGRLSSR